MYIKYSCKIQTKRYESQPMKLSSHSHADSSIPFIFCFLVPFILILIKIYTNHPSMPKRKVWTDQQDRTLLMLKQKMGKDKWTTIASTMKNTFGLPGRTGKQCRERYLNHLHSDIVSSRWSKQEEGILQRMHSQHGNRWSLIAKHLPGRSDNCIKNHFYSKVRKSVRRLNRVFLKKGLKGYRPIQGTQLSKMLQISEEKFKPLSHFSPTTIQLSASIKDQLLRLDYDDLAFTDSVKCQCPLERIYEDYVKYQEALEMQQLIGEVKSGQIGSHASGDQGVKKEERGVATYIMSSSLAVQYITNREIEIMMGTLTS